MKFNEFYKADTDITLQILHQIKQLEDDKNLILLTNIKGHQDKIKSRDKLNYHEKLHIEADEEAAKGQKYKSQRYIEMPANRAHIYLDKTIITSKITK